ncbi:hypothetical protein F4774DRAFT_379770 [Daldinia eschscholtzii]|nr:hypothetical protein F4774DRAFT_379770 [Daldinia eschscholtzii]
MDAFLGIKYQGRWRLDPEGDVLLTLRNPNAPFAVWDPDWYKRASSSLSEQNNTKPQDSDPPKADCQTQTKAEFKAEQESQSPHTSDKPTSTSSVKFLLSSRHLCLASPYFKRLLQGPWKEATKKSPDGLRHVDAFDWDEKAMLVLMQAIHGQNYQLPCVYPLEDLAKVAVLVDYYQCHEAVSLWSTRCMQFISITDLFGRDTILTILVGLVFKSPGLFSQATRVAMRECQGQLPTLGLPITAVADLFDAKRKELLDRIFTDLYDFISRLRERKVGCSVECSSMTLGALSIYLHEKGMLDPPLFYPYSGHSLGSAISMVQKFAVPGWTYAYSKGRHSCQLLHGITQNMPQFEGLSLYSIKGHELYG